MGSDVDDAFEDRRRARPKASVATLFNAAAVIFILISGGVSTMLYLSAISADVAVLKSQVFDLREAVHNLSGQITLLTKNGQH